jgi:uncharacterized protein YqjF (DUF2071 family)
MEHKNIFLTAEWSNVLMLNYAVDASLLERFVPADTELDAFGGKTYVGPARVRAPRSAQSG